MISVFTPAIDIALFVLISSVAMYVMYDVVFKRDIAQAMVIDIKFSLARLLLITTNYAYTNTTIELYGQHLSWFWWYILVSVVVDTSLFFLYKWYYAIGWQDFGS